MKGELQARRLGCLPVEMAEIERDLGSMAGPMQTCPGYAAGSWGKWILYLSEPDQVERWTDAGRGARAIRRLIETHVALEYLRVAQIFLAAEGGYVRPHRDWTDAAPLFMRVHIPLRADAGSLSSEGDHVFRMRVGEAWTLDPSIPHSAGCFSKSARAHLVMDFDPAAAPADIMRGLSPCSSLPETELERPAFGEEQLESIRSLSALASPLDFEHLADLLGSVHFEKHVSCEACWDWLAMISAAAGEPTLVKRAKSMRRAFLGPWD